MAIDYYTKIKIMDYLNKTVMGEMGLRDFYDIGKKINIIL